MPAGGSLMKMIEGATGVKSPNMGKPFPELFDLIATENGLQNEPKEKFLMIGDKLDTDIAFGCNVGIDTLLVLTGVTYESKLTETLEAHPEIKPTHILKSVKGIVDTDYPELYTI